MNEILTEAPKGIGAVVQITRPNGEHEIKLRYKDDSDQGINTFICECGILCHWNDIKDLSPILLLAGYTPPVLEPKIYGVAKGVCVDARGGSAVIFSKLDSSGNPWYRSNCSCDFYWHSWADIENPEILFDGVDK